MLPYFFCRLRKYIETSNLLPFVNKLPERVSTFVKCLKRQLLSVLFYMSTSYSQYVNNIHQTCFVIKQSCIKLVLTTQ